MFWNIIRKKIDKCLKFIPRLHHLWMVIRRISYDRWITYQGTQIANTIDVEYADDIFEDAVALGLNMSENLIKAIYTELKRMEQLRKNLENSIGKGAGKLIKDSNDAGLYADHLDEIPDLSDKGLIATGKGNIITIQKKTLFLTFIKNIKKLITYTKNK